MKLKTLKKNFKTGKLDKGNFIDEAMKLHNQLFDYLDIINNTDVNKISITSDGLSFSIGKDNILMFVPPNEKRVAPLEIMNFDKYEPSETRVIDILTLGAKQIIDIGANIGYYTIRLAKKNSSSIIHSFEPMKTSYSYLKKNILANHIGSNVFTYNLALSENSGEIDFFIPPSNGTNASLLNVSENFNSKKVIIKTLTLDQWCKDQKIIPDFIKCDVEGSELLVFKGGKEILNNNKPLIFTELLRKWSKPYGYHPNDMIKFFNEMGYLCFGISKKGVNLTLEVNDQTIETNYAFVHKNKHKDILNKLKNLKW